MNTKTKITTAIIILLTLFALIACSSGSSDGNAEGNPSATYSVTYNDNGGIGSVPADSNQYLPEATVTVLDKGSLARTGYTFTCWNTQADGNGTDRAPAATFAMGNTNVILYAKWTADSTYTVTYNANGGTGSVPADSNQYLPGATVTVLDKGSLARTGYTFTCWNTQADGNGTDRTPASTFTMGAANVILYAKWTANSTLYRDLQCQWRNRERACRQQSISAGSDGYRSGQGQPCKNRLYVYLLEHAGGWKRNEQNACVDIYNGCSQCDPLCKVDGKYHQKNHVHSSFVRKQLACQR